MSGADLGPLDWRIAITDAKGKPTPEFQRRWATQRNNNGLIGVTLGSGAPPASPAPANGAEYADLSATPITLYVGSAGVWVKVGVAKFTDLSDVPHAYTGAAKKLVRVNAGATGLEFVSLAFTDLSDVPNSYTGAAQKVVRVNPGATALEFASVAFGFAWDRPIASMTISKPIRYFDAGIAWTLKASPSGGSHVAQIDGVGPSTTTVFTLKNGSTTIGSFSFAAGALTATFSIAADVSIANTDTVTIVAPANLNGMTGTMYGTIRGERP